MPPSREIERKFLLEQIPELPTANRSRIDQGYLVTEQAELRIRRIGRECLMTVKGEGDLVRDEWETEIPGWVFDALWPRTEGARVEKERYSVAYGDHLLEIDLFRGALEGLCLLEVEFGSEDEASRFTPPGWVGRAVDVTDDPAYKNLRLALDGRPAAAE